MSSSSEELEIEFDTAGFADTGLKADTKSSYKKAYSQFVEYANSRGYAFVTQGPMADDALITAYLMGIKEKKTVMRDGIIEKIGSAGEGEKLLAAIKARSPNVSLPFARRLVKKWKRQNRPFKREAQPFSEHQTLVLIGLNIHRKNYLRALLYTVLWIGWLRVGESLRLHDGSFAWRRHKDTNSLVITLLDTKTQHAEVVLAGNDNELFIKLFKRLSGKVEEERHGMSTRRAGERRIFPWKSEQVRKFLGEDAVTCGITAVLSSKISTHGFRRGAASESFYAKEELRSIMIKGRWRCERSLETYCKDALLLLSNSLTDERGAQFLRSVAEEYIRTGSFRPQGVR